MPSIRQYKKRHEALKNERSTWIDHWLDLSEHFLPRRGRHLSAKGQNPNKGDKRNQKIIDSTVRDAVKTNSAGMMSGLTSPSRPWFRLVTPDPDMMEFAPIRQWLYIVENRMREWFTKSNLYSVLPSVYQELSVFGTAAMGEYRPAGDISDFSAPPVFYGYTIGSYAVAQDTNGEINTFYREFDMTVAQLVDRFGIENVTETVRNQYQNGHVDQWIHVTHLIEPNLERKTGSLLSEDKPFRSVWYEQSATDDTFLSKSGFDEFPNMVPRWDTTSEDVYGVSSPGIDALGDAKALQIQQKRKAQAIDKHVDPPLQAPSSLRGKIISMLPGDVTYYDQVAGVQGVRSLYDFNPQIDSIRQDIAEIQFRINRMFYTDLFRLISNSSDTNERTAYEVAQLHEEKLLMLGPVLENLNKGLLKPLIDRTFAMMMRSGLLPPPPDDLAGVDLKVEYISVLAQAQRMVGLSSIERLVGFVGSAAQYDPSVLDKFDFDQAVDDYSEGLGTPPSLVRTDDDVAVIRQQRAAQARAKAIAENAAPMAKAAKDLSETDAEKDSGLSRIVQAVAGA